MAASPPQEVASTSRSSATFVNGYGVANSLRVPRSRPRLSSWRSMGCLEILLGRR